MYDPEKTAIRKMISDLKFSEDYPASTDGIGTKGIYHWMARKYPEINSSRRTVLDALGMNFNDMAVKRAKIILLQNHIFLPNEDEEVLYGILKTFKEECEKRDIRIASGETAIHDDMSGLEISVSVIGEYIQKRENIFEPGDYLIGITSEGLMSNGFTKVRGVFGNNLSKEKLEELTRPTPIYYDAVLDILNKFDIHGMRHITGGAYTKLRDSLNGNTDVIINRNHKLKPQEIFNELYQSGISDREMYRMFNCGVGFMLSVLPEESDKILHELRQREFESDIVGEVIGGSGKISIESMFSNRNVVL